MNDDKRHILRRINTLENMAASAADLIEDGDLRGALFYLTQLEAQAPAVAGMMRGYLAAAAE